MKKFISNIKGAYVASVEENQDRGSLVETLILVAGFALAAILVVTWISTAVINKGADIAACVEGANVMTGTTTACTSPPAHDSYTKNSTYTSRYGIAAL